MQLLHVIRQYSHRIKPWRACINVRSFSTEVQSQDEKTGSINVKNIQKPTRKPFVKNLFLGKFDTEFLSFPEVLEVDKLQELQNKVATIESIFLNDGTTDINKQKLEEIKNLGLYGLQVPQEYGGLGLTATEYARIYETLSLDGPVAIALTAHQSHGLTGLLTAGSKQQKEEYLPRLASGEWISAFCFAESNSGITGSGVETEAKLSDDKWYLNGRKILVSSDGNADLLTVIAKTEKNEFGGQKSEVATAFLVERTFDGVSFEKTAGIVDGGAKVCEVQFNNTPVPQKNLLGEVGDGYKICVDVLGSNRFSAGSFSAGILKQLLAKVSEHCISHKQFGKELMNFEMIQEKIARITTSIYIMESLSYFTAAILDNYENPDASVESAITKVYSSDMLCNGIIECQNILGGEEFLKMTVLDTNLRNSRIFMYLEGSNEVLRSFIALSGLQYAGIELKDDIEKVRNPLMFPTYVLKKMIERRNHTKDHPKLTLGLDGYVHPSLIYAARQLEYGVLRMQFVVELLLARYGRNVIEKEIELNRLADITIGLYVMTCVLARASRSYCIGIQDSESEVITAQAICYNTSEMVRQKVKEISDGPITCFDKHCTKIAQKVYGQRGYFLEHPLTRNIF